MSRVITYVYAHNNQEDALRFRDQVHEILRGNKRYISNEILLVSQQEPVIKDNVLPSEEDGNMILQINGYQYYHCVKIVFIYKDQEPTSISIISLFYRCGDRFHADNSSKCYTSQLCKTDLSVLHKIAKLYHEEFEFGQLDENIIIGPQVGVFPSRRFSTSDVTNTVVDQENLNTKGGSSMTPRHPHSEPAMISWVDKLDSLMSKDDPDYDRFQKFKELWKETIATGIATKNLRLNCFKSVDTDCNVSWLKVLPDPNDSDGDVPNIKGLKELFDNITKYTFSWARTGIKDIDDNMIKVGTYASTCKSIIEGKSSLHEIALGCASCFKDKEEDIVDNTVKQINELKHRLRTLPDPRYLPNVKYATRLIDDLNYLLNNKDSVKEDKEKHTYSISSDTLYKAVLKIRAIRDSFSKPGMWVDSQTSCWIHTNKDYETLKVLKTYLECEAKKYVNYQVCIIETDMMNHMINLIDDALNLYAVDPE